VFADTHEEAIELTNQSGIGIRYPLEIQFCVLSQDQCLKYLKHISGCRTRERTYVDEFHYNAIMIIFYKDEKYGPSSLDELRYVTQEIYKAATGYFSRSRSG